MTLESSIPSIAEPMTDDQVVSRVRGGDTPLFEVLMRRHNQRLYRVARAILRSEAEIEDVMQQAYVLAFTHLDQFAGTAKFSTWLLRIGVNEALARVRQAKRHLQSVDDLVNSDSQSQTMDLDMRTPEDRVVNHELAAMLERTIDQLPSKYREVFVLRLVEGLDTAETASILGLGEDVVKQRLHRARAMAQKTIAERVEVSASTLFEFHAPRCDRVVAATLIRLRMIYTLP